MCPGCQVPMGVKAVIEDRPGTDPVTVIYDCPICETETQRHQKGVDSTNRTPGLATSAHRVGCLLISRNAGTAFVFTARPGSRPSQPNPIAQRGSNLRQFLFRSEPSSRRDRAP